MLYPALKAVIDDLIAQGFSTWEIARRVKTRRRILQRHPTRETIGTYCHSVAAPMSKPRSRSKACRQSHLLESKMLGFPEEIPMEHAPAGQAQGEPLAENAPADDDHQKEYIAPVDMLGVASQ